jgi:hypothetical protein
MATSAESSPGPLPNPPGGPSYAWHAHPAVRVAAEVLTVAIGALAVWLALLRTDDAASVAEPEGGPVPASQSDLAALSARLDAPIYWAGTRSGTRLEATLTANEYAYVRYLSADAPIGDPSSRYLTVATYGAVNALAHLRSYAHHEHASTKHIPGGGLAVPVPDSPTSVYFARPDQDIQVEVYDPRRGEALRLIKSGAIEPVAGGVTPPE